MQDERFIIKAVEMHYKQDLSQQEIAKRLNVSRTTISRALARARAEGYVQIQINYPDGYLTNIESQLEERYGLREAIVAHERDDMSMGEQIGSFAADYLLRTIRSNMTIGLTRGTSLKHMVECLRQDVRLKFLKVKGIDVVPLQAAANPPLVMSVEERLAYTNYLLDEFARIIGGSSYQLLAPQFVNSPEVRDLFMEEPSIKGIFDLLSHADLAVFGIGTVSEDSTLVKASVISDEEVRSFRRQGGVSELLSHVLDAEGNVVDRTMEGRIMSLSLEGLKRIPVRMAVAYGEEKREAIRSVLRGGYANVLVTDEAVARYLIEE